MKIRLTQVVTGLAISMSVLTPPVSHAQVQTPLPVSDTSVQFSQQQLEQILAPVALYPDQLLAQIMMAATYPLEVVQADRWLQDPNNAALRGDQLSAALEQQGWDPSVKSLVPFPQLLHMMDSNLSWTEQLGDAFLSSQSSVMDTVQTLRQQAQSSGHLQSSQYQQISSQEDSIVIEPAAPDTVYVPVYNPAIAYGTWAYPDFPPYYFPDFFAGMAVGAFGFGWFGFGIDVPLWGWSRWDWAHRDIYVIPGRFGSRSRQDPHIAPAPWRHDPAHRAGVPYRDPDTRNHFQPPGTRQNFRGYPANSLPQIPSNPVRPAVPAPVNNGRMIIPEQRPIPEERRIAPPSFESFGRGVDVRGQSERGHESRQSMPATGGVRQDGRKH